MDDVSFVSKDWLSLAAIVLAFFFGAAYGAGEASAQESWEAPNLHNWTLVIYDYAGPWEGDFASSPGGEVDIASSQVVFINNSETVEAIVFVTEPDPTYTPQLISMMLIDNEDGAVVNTARGLDSVYMFYGGGVFIGGDASVKC